MFCTRVSDFICLSKLNFIGEHSDTIIQQSSNDFSKKLSISFSSNVFHSSSYDIHNRSLDGFSSFNVYNIDTQSNKVIISLSY